MVPDYRTGYMRSVALWKASISAHRRMVIGELQRFRADLVLAWSLERGLKQKAICSRVATPFFLHKLGTHYKGVH